MDWIISVIANAGLMEIHKKLGIPLAGTNDCHYLKKDDARPHELMLCLQTGKTVSDPNRMKFDTDQLYVKSTEEIAPAFAEFPGAVTNTCRIADHVRARSSAEQNLSAAISHSGRVQGSRILSGTPRARRTERTIERTAEPGRSSRSTISGCGKN